MWITFSELYPIVCLGNSCSIGSYECENLLFENRIIGLIAYFEHFNCIIDF